MSEHDRQITKTRDHAASRGYHFERLQKHIFMSDDKKLEELMHNYQVAVREHELVKNENARLAAELIKG